MKSTPLWILALDVFVSFIIVLGNSAQVVADNGYSDAMLIDCGANESYKDPKNGFDYEADDDKYVESGKMYKVLSNNFFKSEQIENQLSTLRSFPDGTRNCYTLRPQQGKNKNYLSRAFFAYGNYDNKNSTPVFDLHLGVNFWTTVELDGPDYVLRAEVIHVSPADNIDVCLINTGQGIPFISLLELWPLPDSLYQPASSLLPLKLMTRPDLGMTEDVVFIRYSDDIYGRSWFNADIDNSEKIITSAAIDSDVRENTYKLPKEVLSTAVQSVNVRSPLVIPKKYDTSYDYYVYLHFYDFNQRQFENQNRSMNINFPDAVIEPLTLEFQKPHTIVHNIKQGAFRGRISITSTSGSDLPAMLNAYEIYQVLPQINPTTHEEDVYALRNIKKVYKIMRINWQGDPCMPSKYRWELLTCNSDRVPRVISLNLSWSNLTGEINASFSNLIKLESLDLSNNELTGEIPEFLAKIPNLKLLNLTGNNLIGSIPKALKDKSTLTLSVEGNPGLCLTGTCKSRRHKFIVPVVASVLALVAVVVVIVCVSMILKRFKKKKQTVMFTSSKKDGQLKTKNQSFCYSEIVSITNDFETVIGEGGFGKVYLGTLQDGTQVAVKLLSKSSHQGFREFQSEQELLMVFHHRNLVSLVGYCDDGDVKALIYEYMTKGNLQHQLSDKNPYVLKWNERLRIALEAACGLDYLHNFCRPPVIHRDLKTSNILLNEYMQAKIADFGLSRAFNKDNDTHISTRPAGTVGYLDPEFHSSGNLNRTSDVYSFGIILLELMTGQPAIRGTAENTVHILQCVTTKMRSGDIQSIVDPRLEGKFSTNSAWRFLEIAMSCIPPAAIQRPDISHIVTDLKECLALEISLESAGSNSRISSTTSAISYFHLESDIVPHAR